MSETYFSSHKLYRPQGEIGDGAGEGLYVVGRGRSGESAWKDAARRYLLHDVRIRPPYPHPQSSTTLKETRRTLTDL
jgi:hypothetical protein